jgi:hypothetical protein
MRVILSDETKRYFITNKDRYAMGSEDKFIRYFFPNIMSDSNENLTLNIYGIQLDDVDALRNDAINVMICVENCEHHRHYKHYNQFGNFGNDKISVYFYNHIDHCMLSENSIAIPVIYSQMHYFSRYFGQIKPSTNIPFHERKFCLFATSPQDYLRNDKMRIIGLLSSIGQCHDIKGYSHLLHDKSCYHSAELLDVFNQYKFVFVSENSIADGYITEKIFNCLFARTIPIYYGSKKISKYINKRAFIEVDLYNLYETREAINEQLVSGDMLKSSKIADGYIDENYDMILKVFIENKRTMLSHGSNSLP